MDTLIEPLVRLARRHPGEILFLGVVLGLVALGFLWLARHWWRSRRRRSAEASSRRGMDVGSLPAVGPPPEPPVLEFFNLPVRLAIVVLAPVGRLRDLPAPDELPETLDAVVPGLGEVALAHQPAIHFWPRQVSVRGFAHAFFDQVRLPGDHGRKSPWCSVAGVFRVDDHPMMAGLVLCASGANRHAQHIMTDESQWLGVLRIRLDEPR
ncbi:MAG: hypothetical protein JW809_04660 [Pirellulales bacterium]|nr:hypothetical protein [Pirellulales bacterium]